MKVLVATNDTQGQRANDFQFVPEGEQVIMGVDCHREPLDGRCGCRRALVGIAAHKGGTTFKVVEVTNSPCDIRAALLEHYVSGCWITPARGPEGEYLLSGPETKLIEAVYTAHQALIDSLSSFPVGTILERRGDRLLVRARAAAASR